jgi:hypothetical protein
LLNNFAKETAGFTGWEIGLLQSVREIPGFLAFTAIFWFLIMREQTMAYLSLALLGLGIALTGYFPTLTGLLVTTTIMSVGFHYFETANQSLSLQLLPKAQAPKVLGQIAGAAAGGQLVAYGLLALAWITIAPSFETLYLVTGILTVVLTIAVALSFGRFQGTVPQRKTIVLRRRYWLYYALTFMSGARRQLFMAFGGFLLVERFGYDVAGLAKLLFVTCAINLLARRCSGASSGASASAARSSSRTRSSSSSSWATPSPRAELSRRAVRPRRRVLHADPGAAHLLPEDRRSRRHRPHRLGRLHHQPHRRRGAPRHLRMVWIKNPSHRVRDRGGRGDVLSALLLLSGVLT